MLSLATHCCNESGRQPFRTIAAIAVAAIAAACLAGCGDSRVETGESGPGRLKVVATTGMIADLVAEVGGSRVEVTGLMGPGVDPHYYKATRGDLEHLTEARVIFYNGLFLEGKLDGIFRKMARTGTVIAVSSAVPEDQLRKPAEFDGNYDPHIWFDVDMWRSTIGVVAAALSKADPEGASLFEANGARYGSELAGLDAWVRQRLGQIPEERRVLVTAHDAFGYFGRAYGIDVVGLQGISTVAEYGVADVRHLVDLIVARGVPAIFVESSVPERSINAVREGCLARGHEVVIGGTLYSDAMGGPGSGADTYAGMVRSNVDTIVEALK